MEKQYTHPKVIGKVHSHVETVIRPSYFRLVSLYQRELHSTSVTERVVHPARNARDTNVYDENVYWGTNSLDGASSGERRYSLQLHTTLTFFVPPQSFERNGRARARKHGSTCSHCLRHTTSH